MIKGAFLTSKKFVRHLLLILLCFVVLLFLFFQFLKYFTHHGVVFQLPNIVGKTVMEIESGGEVDRFEIVIIDSVFKENTRSGEILRQSPPSGAIVKQNRKIYLTVASSMPELIPMVGCTDQSLKAAVSQLVSAGLRVGTLSFEPGEISKFVVAQSFKGKPIEKGENVRLGSPIDLVVEINPGITTSAFSLLQGKTEVEACQILWSAGMNVGKISYDGTRDKQRQRIIAYSPAVQSATIGTTFDLVFMHDSLKGYQKKKDAFQVSFSHSEMDGDEDVYPAEDLY